MFVEVRIVIDDEYVDFSIYIIDTLDIDTSFD